MPSRGHILSQSANRSGAYPTRYKCLTACAAFSIALLFAGFSQPAHAGGGYKYNYGSHHYNYHWDSRYKYNRYKHHRRYHRHRNHHHNTGAYILGGLAIGAIISHALHDREYRVTERRDRYYRNNRVVRRSVPADVPITRSLFKDRHGNCYERKIDGAEELLIELPADACDW